MCNINRTRNNKDPDMWSGCNRPPHVVSTATRTRTHAHTGTLPHGCFGICWQRRQSQIINQNGASSAFEMYFAIGSQYPSVPVPYTLRGEHTTCQISAPSTKGAGAIYIERGVEHTTCQIVSRARTLATTARASRMAIASMLGPAKGNRPHHSVRTQRLKGCYSTTNPAACQRNTGQHSFVRRHHGPRSDSIAALLPHCWELILAGKRGMGVRLNG